MKTILAIALVLAAATPKPRTVKPIVSGPATAPILTCPAGYDLGVALGRVHWFKVSQPRTLSPSDYRPYLCWDSSKGMGPNAN